MATVVSKVWWQSKTVWVAFFVFVASILVATGTLDIPLDPDSAWIGIAWSIVQTILRFFTKSSVSATK